MKTCKTCKHKNEDNECLAITTISSLASIPYYESGPQVIDVTDDFGCVLHEEIK
jgi:hypothetical protein